MVLHEIRKRAGYVAGPLLGLTLIGYFGYHLVEGERGLLAWLHLTQRIKLAEAQLADLDAEKARLDRRAGLLRPDHLDRDMLDERVRATLNLAAPDEIVIMGGGTGKR